MRQSESINEIAAALAKAQGEMEPAVFDRVNPHFKSKYATLTAIMDTVKRPLAKNNLAVVQSLEGSRDAMYLVTKIVHSSGQWIADDGIPLVLDKNNMQGLGSAMSYAKRYGISSLLTVVADEDDDAEGAVGRPESKQVTQQKAAPPKKQKPAESIDLSEVIVPMGSLSGKKLKDIEPEQLQVFLDNTKKYLEGRESDLKAEPIRVFFNYASAYYQNLVSFEALK